MSENFESKLKRYSKRTEYEINKVSKMIDYKLKKQDYDFKFYRQFISNNFNTKYNLRLNFLMFDKRSRSVVNLKEKFRNFQKKN